MAISLLAAAFVVAVDSAAVVAIVAAFVIATVAAFIVATVATIATVVAVIIVVVIAAVVFAATAISIGRWREKSFIDSSDTTITGATVLRSRLFCQCDHQHRHRPESHCTYSTKQSLDHRHHHHPKRHVTYWSNFYLLLKFTLDL